MEFSEEKNSLRWMFTFKEGLIIDLGILIGILTFFYLLRKSLTNRYVAFSINHIEITLLFILFFVCGWIISNLLLKLYFLWAYD